MAYLLNGSSPFLVRCVANYVGMAMNPSVKDYSVNVEGFKSESPTVGGARVGLETHHSKPTSCSGNDTAGVRVSDLGHFILDGLASQR